MAPERVERLPLVDDDGASDAILQAGKQRETKRYWAAVGGLSVASLIVVGLTLSNLRGVASPASDEDDGLGPGLPARLLPAPPPQSAGRRLCERTAQRPHCPAHDLFSDPDVHQKVSQNLMWAGHQFCGLEARDNVSTIVAATFHQLGQRLEQRAPRLATLIKHLQLSASEKQAVLSSMQLVVDDRVQAIGRSVAASLLDGAPPPGEGGSGGRALTSRQRRSLVSELEKSLKPSRDKIREVLDEVPDSLHALWGSGKTKKSLSALREAAWEMALEPAMLSSITRPAAREPKNGGTHHQRSKTSLLGFSATLEQKNSAIFGAALLQGRALLDVLQMCAQVTGNSLIPLNGTADLAPNLSAVSCELAIDGQLNFEDHRQKLLCELRFGAQGVGALKAALLGDRLDDLSGLATP